MNDQFRRILDLVRRTGDRMVVTDPEGNDAFVVMDLESYEQIIDLEDEVFEGLEGVAPEETPTNDPLTPTSDIFDHMPSAGQNTETWDINKLSSEELAELEKKFAEFSEKVEEVAANEDVGRSQEDVVLHNESEETPTNDPLTPAADSKEDDEFGEEQFYLEPIE
jgi:hypothetical protein